MLETVLGIVLAVVLVKVAEWLLCDDDRYAND